MYTTIMAADSYGRYNRKLVKLTNLQTAVYWSEILDIIAKVVKKKKFDDQGYFNLDRKYVEDRTGLGLETQLECDSILERLSVLNRHDLDANLIKVDLDTMLKILVDDNVKKLDLPKGTIKPTRSQKAADKKAAILITMKRCLSETEPELRLLYESWIDSVYENKYFLTRQKIQIFEDAINNYSTDRFVKLKLLNIAIQTGYTDPTWIFSRYESQSKSKSNISATQKTSTGVSDKFEF